MPWSKQAKQAAPSGAATWWHAPLAARQAPAGRHDRAPARMAVASSSVRPTSAARRGQSVGSPDAAAAAT